MDTNLRSRYIFKLMKDKILILFALISASVLVGQTANISVTEGGATTYRNLPIDSEALTSGLLLGGKANVDGSNVENAAQWRSILDVLTDDQISALLADYVKTVGGVAPDGDGDVTGLSASVITDLGSNQNPDNGYLPVWEADGSYRNRVRVRAGTEGFSIAVRGGQGNLRVRLSATPHYEDATNVSWVTANAPTIASSPDPDVSDKTYYPAIKVPEAGTGDKVWEWQEGIPSGDIVAASSVGWFRVLSVAGTQTGVSLQAAHHNTLTQNTVLIRGPNGHIGSPTLSNIKSSTSGQIFTSREYVDTTTANLTNAPAADTVEKRYSVELVVPATGDGDPYFEYAEIP